MVKNGKSVHLNTRFMTRAGWIRECGVRRLPLAGVPVPPPAAPPVGTRLYCSVDSLRQLLYLYFTVYGGYFTAVRHYALRYHLIKHV